MEHITLAFAFSMAVGIVAHMLVPSPLSFLGGVALGMASAKTVLHDPFP